MPLKWPTVYPLAEKRKHATSLVLPVPPNRYIDFYHDLDDPFLDSKTNMPVHNLAQYQLDAIEWSRQHRKLLILKGQKMGISSTFIVETLHHALTDCQSFELVILAQSKEKAIEHGRDFRRILANSKYADYLITRPSDAPGLLRDEITKMTEVFLHTRTDRMTPTRIHILSPSHTQIASIKRVKFAWLSDITMSKDVAERQETWFMTLMSRLVLTEGPVVIECPTVGHLGPIWRLDDHYQNLQKAGKEPGEHDFVVKRLTVQRAIDAGLMSEEAVDALRRQHGPMFAALFEAEWFAGDSSWYSKDQIKHNDAATSFADD